MSERAGNPQTNSAYVQERRKKHSCVGWKCKNTSGIWDEYGNMGLRDDRDYGRRGGEGQISN